MGDEAKARDRAEEEKEENKNERSESPTSPATDESILEGLSDEIQEMLKVHISELAKTLQLPVQYKWHPALLHFEGC